MKLSTTGRNAAVDAVAALLNGGTLEFRTGAAPANPQAADSGTLLGTATFGATAFGAAVAGVATANAIAGDSSADASGTVGHVRVKRSTGAVVADLTVSVTGGGGEVQMPSLALVAGVVISVTSMTFTQPE